MKTALRLTAALLALIFVLAAGCQRKSGNNEYTFKDEKLACAGPSTGSERVFYEIFVGSFADSDGDGKGDLKGITEHIDYLNDGKPDSGKSLGVEGLWLTPIFKSPSYHKYDITDYYTVDPEFGTEEDLRELINVCHERDMLIILDLPINHTGKMNDWFNKFVIAQRSGDTSDEYYDYYTWYEGGTENAPAGRVFSQIAGTDRYYECNFSGDMPELNFDNERVVRAVLDVAYHYLDMGIDGFRFDAAKYVFFGDHAKNAEFWEAYVGKLRERKPDIYTVAEVWDGDGVVEKYMKATDCFNFSMSQAEGYISNAAKKGDANIYTAYVDEYLKTVKALRSDASITPFVSNHDMDRAAGFLTVASGYMKMAANLYILGPGTPFIYYGEEIGMRGSRGAANTDSNRRLAMLWGDDSGLKDPVGASYPADKQVETTVKDQLTDPDSLYNYYKKLIMIRRANPEISRGEYEAIRVPDSKVGCFKSTLEGSTVYVLHNPSGSSQRVELASLGITANDIRAIIGVESASIEGTFLVIGAQTSVVLK